MGGTRCETPVQSLCTGIGGSGRRRGWRARNRCSRKLGACESPSSVPPGRWVSCCAPSWPSAGFPVDEMRYLASSRSAGTTLPWGDQRHPRGGRGRRPISPASTWRCARPRRRCRGALAPAAGRGRARSSSTTRRPGAWIPTSRWWCPRPTPRRWRPSPRGSWPTRTARRWWPSRCSSRCTTRRDSTASSSRRIKRSRAAAWRRCASWPSSWPRPSTGRRTSPSTVAPWTTRRSSVYPVPIAHNVHPAAVQDRRRRLAGDRRGAEVPQREPARSWASPSWR